MKKFIVISVLVLAANLLFSQNHVDGELLVQMKYNTDINELIDDFNSQRNNTTRLRPKKTISSPLRIYTITYDNHSIDPNKLISNISKDSNVQHVQFNHILKLRDSIPNDPQFPDQWQYINTGQTGGTSGADLDAELAWDITTGGLTTQNDTIVACVIDAGFDISHPDLASNLWVNNGEIPDNGIDDDGNGFVDDYRGWNTGTQDDTIEDGDDPSHGTAVAGIIGAVGNNGVGVAGVNWDVKVMAVSGGTGVESEVLEAYSYAYTARRRYNETNGEEGAFVVTTNASWGVDGGQAADAPIWCSFYDSLGVIGILNAGATINDNQNVDEFGDLPTSCPSDFLLSVTNLDHNDEKILFAGFGKENIDIGAFGQGTWTLTDNGGYADFGGTSGATPHVAGAIALLYSSPCNEFIEIAKSDPALAALLVRNYILSGGEDNASLQDITATGKRLNLNNSLNLLINDCGSCPAPFSLTANQITDISATLDWTELTISESDTVRWRKQGDQEWNFIADAVPPLNITGLESCNLYEFQVRSSCMSGISDYTDSFVFESDGCCRNPTFVLEENAMSSITLSWQSVLGSETYTILLSDIDGASIQELDVPDTQVVLGNLEECTEYQVQIRANCQGINTGFSDAEIFETSGCGACLDQEYCPGDILIDNFYEWIQSIEFDGQLIETGNIGVFTDYEDAYDLIVELNEMHTIAINPGFENNDSAEVNFFVWIDFNGNGSFEQEELVMEEFSDESVTANFNVPEDAAIGLTKMRVVMIVGDLYNNTPCDWDTDPFGEIEDYCVLISDQVSSTNDILSSDFLTLIPNPNRGQFSIEWDDQSNDQLSNIKIFSALGNEVTEKSIQSPEDLNINMHHFPDGIYFINAHTNNGKSVTKKFIKSN